MKSFLFIFSLLIVCVPSVGFADDDRCADTAMHVAWNYFEFNKDKQITEENIHNHEERKRARLTNLCFQMVHTFVLESEFRHCELNEGRNTPSFLIKHEKWTLDEVDAGANVDCFNAPDYERIEMMLEKYGDSSVKMFLPNVDVIVKQIMNGNDPKLISRGIIDASPHICYTADSDGNTIWHAYAKTNAYMLDVANLCASSDVNENDEKFFVALLFDENKDGETPMYIAFKNAKGYQKKGFDYSMVSKKSPIIKFVRDYIKSNNENCERVVQEIYDQSDKFEKNLGMSVNNIKNAFGCSHSFGD